MNIKVIIIKIWYKTERRSKKMSAREKVAKIIWIKLERDVAAR